MEQSVVHVSQPGTVLHRFNGAGCGVNRDLVLPGNDAQSLDVVGMFMGNQYSVYIPSRQLQLL